MSDPSEDSLTLFPRWKLGLLVVAAAVAIGCASAFFLWSLEGVTRLRFGQPWLLFLLPLVGVAVAWLYQRHGGEAEGGNALIIERIHDPGGGLPRRMAPLVVLGTLATHLCGGSAGREGTAVQLGGSLAGAVGRGFPLDPAALRTLLMTGMAAGFGAVFGTPWAGALFAIEVAEVGRPKLRALPACLLAALVGDQVCRAWGAGHTHFRIDGAATYAGPLLLGKVVLAAMAFGLVGRGFAGLVRGYAAGLKRLVPLALARPAVGGLAVGGLAVIGLFFLCGRADYLGLGVWSPDPAAVSLVSLFGSEAIHPWSWAWKIAFTVVTVGSGFKGGEVTPLFFIGAALGNALAGLLGAPPELFAALGFVAVFAGAANTPLACLVMGIELFGAAHALPLALACGVAFLCSGHGGLYRTQRFAIAKPVWRRKARR